MALYDRMTSIHDCAVQRPMLTGNTDIPVQTGRDQPGSTAHGVFIAAGKPVIVARTDGAWMRRDRLTGGGAPGRPSPGAPMRGGVPQAEPAR